MNENDNLFAPRFTIKDVTIHKKEIIFKRSGKTDMSAFSLPLLFCKRSYSSVRNDYGVQALAPTITLEFYLMSFHFI